MLTADRLRSLLNYDPLTGVFTRKVRTSNRVRVGDEAGNLVSGYREISVDAKSYRAHRLAWLYMTGSWPSGEVDHINGVRDDNRWDNLRDVPHRLNIENQRRARSDNKSSGLLGVCRDKKRWAAKITIAGKMKHVGTFDLPEQAHAAYLEAKRQLHAGCTL